MYEEERKENQKNFNNAAKIVSAGLFAGPVGLAVATATSQERPDLRQRMMSQNRPTSEQRERGGASKKKTRQKKNKKTKKNKSKGNGKRKSKKTHHRKRHNKSGKK
jgi:hypothetical protein